MGIDFPLSSRNYGPIIVVDSGYGYRSPISGQRSGAEVLTLNFSLITGRTIMKGYILLSRRENGNE